MGMWLSRCLEREKNMKTEEMFPLLEVSVMHEGEVLARGQAKWANTDKEGVLWDCSYSQDDLERTTVQYACANVLVAQCNNDRDVKEVHKMLEELWTQVKDARLSRSD